MRGNTPEERGRAAGETGVVGRGQPPRTGRVRLGAAEPLPILSSSDPVKVGGHSKCESKGSKRDFIMDKYKSKVLFPHLQLILA